MISGFKAFYSSFKALTVELMFSFSCCFLHQRRFWTNIWIRRKFDSESKEKTKISFFAEVFLKCLKLKKNWVWTKKQKCKKLFGRGLCSLRSIKGKFFGTMFLDAYFKTFHKAWIRKIFCLRMRIQTVTFFPNYSNRMYTLAWPCVYPFAARGQYWTWRKMSFFNCY